MNATLFPVSKFETELYQKYHFNPLQIEANIPDEIIPHVSGCDAIFAIAVSFLSGTFVCSGTYCVDQRIGCVSIALF